MKIWVFSDLHLQADELEDRDILTVIPEADLCVVAGDLIGGDIVRGMEWLAENIRPQMRTIFVPGNHEFYGRAIDEVLEAGRRSAIVNGIDFLDDEAINFGQTRIFGTTLWTDFSVFAGDDGAMRGHAMEYAAALMNDFRIVRPYEAKPDRWTPTMSLAQHMSSRAALEAQLATSKHPVVVVSHHAPHRKSIAPEFAKDLLTPSFVSDLSQVIERYRPPLWIHGHTHRLFDYMVGATRIVCNPRGYRHERTGFEPGKVVSLDSCVREN